ncbi:alginate export family protein [Nitrospira sp. M1]
MGLGVFLWSVTGIAEASSELTTQHKRLEAVESSLFQGTMERVQSTSQSSLLESADAVLIRTKEWQWNRYVKNALNLPTWIDLGFEHRTRFETYDHPWRSSQPLGQTDSQVQQRSRLRFGLNGGAFRFLFEGQDSRVHLDGPGDFVNTGIRNEWDILQLFVSATGDNVMGSGLRTDVHVGRMTMDFGHRRLIARNDFRNTTNAFDGVHWQLAKDKVWRIRTFLVEPVLRDQTELDEQSKRSVFWGVYGESTQIPWLRLNLYYFGLNDQRSSTVSAQRSFSTFGLRLYEDPKRGRPDYDIESVWQTGRLGNTDHFAHFQHIDLGYTFNIPWSPRFVMYYDYASGDRNPNDSQDSSFDTLFGARRFELNPTGNFGPFFRTNISSPGWRVIVTPVKGWRLQVKHRVWYLATSRGAFASNGLRDVSGGSGNFLGHDVELRVQWKVSDNLEFDAGYLHWFKGSYFDRLPASAGLPPGGNKDTDYLYILTKVSI